jgi:fructose-bisphosphate aldolase, class II
MFEVCKERFIAFNAAGQASKIRVTRLPDMARAYSKVA